MLELEVVPERSLGCEQWEFILGMHFSQAVAIIQSQVGIIKGVQVLYSDMNPLAVDLIIILPQDGIRLIFDPVVQRLKFITRIFVDSGLAFNSAEVLPSIEQIEHSFGATHPGVYDTEKQLFVLNFRGLSFCFPVESKFQFPNGSSPVVSRMSIYTGNNVCESGSPPLPLCCYNNHLYMDRVEVIRERHCTKGIRLHLFTE
ncbi:unnamed protein product, partial [Timema podura]|nr:unnamed protein product [Timema podura]